MRYAYPARIEQHPGTVLVYFPDFPEAVTEGADRAAALLEAVDCLDAAILFRLKERVLLPEPSRGGRGLVLVPASPAVAAKAAFIRAFDDSGMTRVALGEKLGLAENEIRRMLDPGHGTKIDRLGDAMVALGRRFVLADEAA
ncbi:MAG: type II toxin-antitoxin system HicB family antitoxin [Bauldia sp.]|nr:type II toxin-antitoxin system HicB family antitoxin [Bauldia sp.]